MTVDISLMMTNDYNKIIIVGLRHR